MTPKLTALNTHTYLSPKSRYYNALRCWHKQFLISLWGCGAPHDKPPCPACILGMTLRSGAGVANSTGFIDPGIFNTAKITGLAPGTRYYYIYGDEVSNSKHVSTGTVSCGLKPFLGRAAPSQTGMVELSQCLG